MKYEIELKLFLFKSLDLWVSINCISVFENTWEKQLIFMKINKIKKEFFTIDKLDSLIRIN